MLRTMKEFPVKLYLGQIAGWDWAVTFPFLVEIATKEENIDGLQDLVEVQVGVI